MPESWELPVKKGKIYYLCTCGRSARLPLCDGRHAGTQQQPNAYSAKSDRILRVLFNGIIEDDREVR